MKRTSMYSWVIAGIAFLLPWQTRWMYDVALLGGAHTEYGIMSVFFVEVLVMMAMIVGAMTLRSIDVRHHVPLRLGAALCIVMILGAAFADRGVFSLAMATHVLFAYAFFVLMLLEQVSIRVLCGAFALGLVPSMILGMTQTFTGISPASTWLGLASRSAAQLGDAVFTVDGERVLRAYGTFAHPNVFGGYLGVGLFAWWHVLASFRSTWSARRYVGVGVLGTALFLFGLLLTGSRSAMLGVLLGVLLTLVARGVTSSAKRVTSILGISVTIIAASLIASFTFTDFVAELRGGGVNEERSLAERVALYEDFVPFIMVTNPIVGHGVGSYVLSYADFDSGKPAYSYQPIHNAFLLFFAETGILGVFFLFWFLAIVLRNHLVRLPQRDALTALGMGSVVLVIAFYDHYLWSSWAGLVLMAFVLGFMARAGEKGDLAVSG